MAIDVSQLQEGLDRLAVTRDEAFARLVTGQRIRFGGPDGTPDLLDDWSARLVYTALTNKTSLFVVFPDTAPRRPPLLFATTLVLHTTQQLREGRAGGRILYVSASSTVREQLSMVSVGTKSLGEMYVREYGRGVAASLQSTGTASSLPRVLCVAAPADPDDLIRRFRPTWIAVDTEDAVELRWLQPLMVAANAARVTVVGWTNRAFGRCAAAWSQSGGAVFRWPRGARNAPRLVRSSQLNGNRAAIEIEPSVLSGDVPSQLSSHFARASQSLASAHQNANGRLSHDTVLMGWRYLRAMESLAAPLPVYEAEASSLWGVPCLSRLRTDLRRFVDASRDLPKVQLPMIEASQSLESAHDLLATMVDPPLWTAAALACAGNGTPRRIVFATRSMRDIFRFALASRFSADDGAPLHTADLTYLAAEDDWSLAGTQPPERVLVGLPSRHGETRMERLLDAGRLKILVWPHQAEVLRWRLGEWNKWFEMSSEGNAPVTIGSNGSAPSSAPSIRLAHQSSIIIEAKPLPTAQSPLWNLPDAASAIRDLFGFDAAGAHSDEPETSLSASDSDTDDGADGQDVLENALRICFENGRSCLVPPSDRVNLVVRGATGMEVQRRLVSEVTPGSMVLLVNGEHRHGLYDLLMGRVHRHPAIAQFVALVARWHEDLATAYRDAARRGLTPERLLSQLQARGSRISCSLTVRNWLDQIVRAPHDAEDLRRLAEVLSMPFVAKYYKQVHTAARKLWGLHISLSARLNRWLETEAAGRAALSEEEHMVDAELGLTLEDFKHSLMPLRVRSVSREQGPFIRSQLGRLEGSSK